MRLFLFLFLTILSFSCVSVSAQDGPIFHIVGDDGNSQSYTFNINGAPVPDPDLTLIAGQTYQFSIDYRNDGNHPFGFTSIQGNSVEALGATGSAGCTIVSSGKAFITTDVSNPCIVNYTANNDAFYRCAFHSAMNGKLTVITPTTTPPTTTTAPPTTTTAPPTTTTAPPTTTTAPPTTTTAPPTTTTAPPTTTTAPPTTTTAPPTTPTPTPTPNPSSIDNSTSSSNITIFHIIGNNGINSYIFNVNGSAVENPSFELVLGQTYQFSIDYINDPDDLINGKPHPFGFTTVAPPTVEALGAIGNANCKNTSTLNTFITTNVSTPCIITYVANVNTFYQCSRHRLMRGALTVFPTNSTNNNSSTPSPTTSTPTTTPTPTSAPQPTFNGTTFHIIGSKLQDSYTFNVNGSAVENPSFELVLGETYQFSIDYLNEVGYHPFGFSRDDSGTIKVEALGAIGNANCKTTSFPDTFVTTDVSKPCIITYVATVNTFYRCAYHRDMKGALRIIGSIVPSSSSSSSSSSSTGVASSTNVISSTSSSSSTGVASSTGMTGGLDGPIFHIVGSVGVQSYTFNINGERIENPALTLKLGQAYQFSIDYLNEVGNHPFGFSTNGGTGASIENLDAVGNAGCKISNNAFITTNISNPCIITYTAKVNAFYRCSVHGPMKGALNVIGGKLPTPTPTTPNTNTTATPTTPPPTESPNCVAGICVNASSSIFTSIYLSIIIASLIALAATAF